jgi:hypothetical protein
MKYSMDLTEDEYWSREQFPNEEYLQNRCQTTKTDVTIYDENELWNKRETTSYACCPKIATVTIIYHQYQIHNNCKLNHQNQVYDIGK